MKPVEVVDLGTRSYGEVLELQRDLAAARIDGRLRRDVLLLVEHPPVVTLGRASKAQHLLASPELLASRGVERFEVERGGDVTFHGPGQLVGYPILDLSEHRRDLHWYLRQVEEVLIRALAGCGLESGRRAGYTGVWTSGPAGGSSVPQDALQPPAGGRIEAGAEPPRKVASIGVHVKQWVTRHGFALNVTTDLSLFDLIVPCGIPDVTMTSIERELGSLFPGSAVVRRHVVKAFGEIFARTPEVRSGPPASAREGLRTRSEAAGT